MTFDATLSDKGSHASAGTGDRLQLAKRGDREFNYKPRIVYPLNLAECPNDR